MEEPTRYQGQEVPSLLDLVFSKKPEPRPNMKYLSPMGRSDHVVLEINLKDWEISKDEEDHKNGRFNYAKGNFTELRKFFGTINWKALMEGKTAQEKYEAFLIKYKEGIQRSICTIILPIK